MTDQYRPVAGLCDTCGAPVRPDEPYSGREISAFEQVSRTGGTLPRLKHKTYTGKVLCPACFKDEQPSLF